MASKRVQTDAIAAAADENSRRLANRHRERLRDPDSPSANAAEYNFGQNVRRKRESRSWSQARLAAELEREGISLHPSAIAKMEGRDAAHGRAIRVNEASAIARVFGCEVDEMLRPPEDPFKRIQYLAGILVSRIKDIADTGAAAVAEVNRLIGEGSVEEIAGGLQFGERLAAELEEHAVVIDQNLRDLMDATGSRDG